MKCSLCNEKIDDIKVALGVVNESASIMPDKCKCICLDCWDTVVLAMEIQLDPGPDRPHTGESNELRT